MTDSVTLNYSWAYPTVGADANTWGGTLNATIIAIDGQVFLAAPKASPTFTGTLTSGGLALANAGLDSTTLDGQGFGLRIRAGVSGNAILQFTNAAGSGQFATLTATVAGALIASGGFSGNLTGNVTGNLMGNASGLSPGVAVANIGYTPANKAGDTFTGVLGASLGVDLTNNDGSNFGLRIRAGGTSGNGIIQFTDHGAGSQYGTLECTGSGLPLQMNGRAVASVASGTTANSGLISWGTASVGGTLDIGQIYLQTN